MPVEVDLISIPSSHRMDGDDNVLLVEIDPAILLSYELEDKLNFNSSTESKEDICKIGSGLEDEIALISSESDKIVDFRENCSEKLLNSGNISPVSDKTADSQENSSEKSFAAGDGETADSHENRGEKPFAAGDGETADSQENLGEKSFAAELEPEVTTENLNESVVCENSLCCERLNQSLAELQLSDSDNETVEDCTTLKGRGGPERRSVRRRKKENSILMSKNRIRDKNQFNPQSLIFLSGSSHVEINDQFNVHRNITSSHGENLVTTKYDDWYRPEFGRESLLAQADSYAWLPEALLDLEMSDHASCASPSLDSNDEDAEEKISRIIQYLKQIPGDLGEPAIKSVEEPKKLSYKLNDKAKTSLRKFLSDDEFYAAKARIYRKIMDDFLNNRDVKVIYIHDEGDMASDNRTNLHYAVLDNKIEDVYCIVEIHKQYDKPLADINIRDRYGKTALDYALQNQTTLVVDYLKENTACRSVII